MLLASSRFAPGVSILVPAYDESGGIVAAVRSLLAIDYPVFEVIVVNDGSSDDTLVRLVDALELVRVESSSRDILETEVVEGYYRSPVDPRILVVDKRNGGKADSLNAAFNHCRYRYVCAVDADMVFARGALTRAMREIVQDPGDRRRPDELLRERSAIRRGRFPTARRTPGPRRARCSPSRPSTTSARSSTTAWAGRGST